MTSSRKNTIILVALVVVAVLFVFAIFLAYFIWRAKRKTTGVHPGALSCIIMYVYFLVYYSHIILVRPVSIGDHTTNVQIENNGPRSRTSQADYLQDNENRSFTYNDLQKFTGNFKQFIGQGGFGVVYFGQLEDGTEVAVKMRSESSSHGLDEFLAEVPN